MFGSLINSITVLCQSTVENRTGSQRESAKASAGKTGQSYRQTKEKAWKPQWVGEDGLVFFSAVLFPFTELLGNRMKRSSVDVIDLGF